MKQQILVICLLLLSSCIDFSISEEEMIKAFEGKLNQPVSETISIDSNHIHYVYVESGRKNLAVFIHGSPGSWSAFMDYMKNDSLLKLYDMVSIDRPGFGKSDPGRPVASLEEQARQMNAVIEQFPHENKVWIGHSLGGPVAARVAMDFPDQVQSMILIAPSIYPAMERYEWYRTWIDTRVGGWFTPQDFWVSNEEILPLKEELRLMLPMWKKISVPTVVIQGTEDDLVPKENAEFARRMIRDTLIDIRYLNEVNHFIPWSHPAEVIKAMDDLAEN
ncbi:MAG: alpha/beta hydrolase [Marinoscillum sp.]